MAVTDQTFTMYAGNRHVLSWEEILDDDDAPIGLGGKVAKFSLTKITASTGLPKYGAPVIDWASDDVGSQITVTAPNGPIEVELLPEDTEDLASKDTDYYFELELFESDGSSPVVVATGIGTIKANVVNA